MKKKSKLLLAVGIAVTLLVVAMVVALLTLPKTIGYVLQKSPFPGIKLSKEDLKCLQVYALPAPLLKKRIGSVRDGGYIVVDNIGTYDLLLSGGINDDITFEEEFLKLHNVHCFAYDGSIEKLPKSSKNITFIKKFIDVVNDDTYANLMDYFDDDSYNDIFLKMDIEGHEYRFFNQLDEQKMRKIKQIAIEIHTPFGDLFKMDILKKLAQTHFLVHVHANNNAGVIKIAGVELPQVFECTYVRKESIGKENDIRLNKTTFPIKDLDSKNNLYLQDISLTRFPFVDFPFADK